MYVLQSLLLLVCCATGQSMVCRGAHKELEVMHAKAGY